MTVCAVRARNAGRFATCDECAAIEARSSGMVTSTKGNKIQIRPRRRNNSLSTAQSGPRAIAFAITNRTLVPTAKIGFCALFISLCLGTAVAAAEEETLGQTIEFLLERVAKADAVFIRNGKLHSPAEAAAHMRAKREHFKAQIKRPEDFIRLAASKSMVTGKPYLIRVKGQKDESVDEWLTAILKERHPREDLQ